MKNILVIVPTESRRVFEVIIEEDIHVIIGYFGLINVQIDRLKHTISTPNCYIRFTYITEFNNRPEYFKGMHFDGVFGKYILAQYAGIIYMKNTRVGRDYMSYVKEVEGIE